jgi:DNA anti-recombination protein RmuC
MEQATEDAKSRLMELEHQLDTHHKNTTSQLNTLTNSIYQFFTSLSGQMTLVSEDVNHIKTSQKEIEKISLLNMQYQIEMQNGLVRIVIKFILISLGTNEQ